MQKPLAIGSRLARFPEILTLGARASLADYPPESLDLIKKAQKIYYPTTAFAAQFVTMGKSIFPSLECHLYAGDKIKQANLFAALGLDHPRTRVYYGRQCRNITTDFSFPFIAKTPRGSAQGRGVFLISSQAELDAYLSLNRPAFIQEYLPISGDIRVVVIGFEPICAYWRLPAQGNFRSNLAQGARVGFQRRCPPRPWSWPWRPPAWAIWTRWGWTWPWCRAGPCFLSST